MYNSIFANKHRCTDIGIARKQSVLNIAFRSLLYTFRMKLLEKMLYCFRIHIFIIAINLVICIPVDRFWKSKRFYELPYITLLKNVLIWTKYLSQSLATEHIVVIEVENIKHFHKIPLRRAAVGL